VFIGNLVVTSSPADNLSLATQKQFERLRQRFAGGLVVRWLEICQAADESALQTQLHRLSGSAGSFGFERLGHLAREAEAHCASADAAALAGCLGQIDAEIRTATQEMPLPGDS
jgi:HPt (histidine-containing phosphotransfer) domain-containing protein